NGRWGINDEPFFPNGHFSNHTATNGNWAMPRSGGSYRISGLNGSGSLVDCYSEGDQWPGVMEGHHQASGVLHAAGLELLTNNIVLGHGAYIGGWGSDTTEDVNIGIFNVRRFWVHDDPVTLTNTEHKAGDFAIATDGKSSGRLCTVAGVNAPLWSSGTTYGKGSIVRTAAGNVYRLAKVPYDPDYWITPRVTVVPT